MHKRIEMQSCQENVKPNDLGFHLLHWVFDGFAGKTEKGFYGEHRFVPC